MPMSAMVSTGRGRCGGSGSGGSPSRVASVMRAKPWRPMDSASTWYCWSRAGVTITSSVSAGAMRNSSTTTGCTFCPSACTTVMRSPGMRTSWWLMAEELMKRNRTRSPGRNRAVKFRSGERPLTRKV